MTSSLLSRLQGLTGPSREIDAEIALALGYEVSESVGADGPLLRQPGELLWNSVPRYTASIEAALTLVPEGYAVQNFTIWPGLPASVTLLATRLDPKTGRYWHSREYGWWAAEAATPAIALLVAILKAQEESKS